MRAKARIKRPLTTATTLRKSATIPTSPAKHMAVKVVAVKVVAVKVVAVKVVAAKVVAAKVVAATVIANHHANTRVNKVATSRAAKTTVVSDADAGADGGVAAEDVTVSATSAAADVAVSAE